jgi:hypothetical protein
MEMIKGGNVQWKYQTGRGRKGRVTRINDENKEWNDEQEIMGVPFRPALEQ